MNAINLMRYLGEPVESLLGQEIFDNWIFAKFSQTIDNTEVIYKEEHGAISVHCDDDIDETIRCVFVKTEKPAAVELTKFTFATSREQMRASHGTPERSGNRSQSSLLGESGA